MGSWPSWGLVGVGVGGVGERGEGRRRSIGARACEGGVIPGQPQAPQGASGAGLIALEAGGAATEPGGAVLAIRLEGVGQAFK